MGGADIATRFYYEDNYLYAVDDAGGLHEPKSRKGSSNSLRCPDGELRGALNRHVGTPLLCGDCRESPAKGKRRCVHEWCANGCEVCGGTGRVERT